MTTNAVKAPKLRKSKLRSNEGKWGYLFIAPWIIGFCLFFLYPLGYSMIVAFAQNVNPKDSNINFLELENLFENFSNALFVRADFVPVLLQSLKDMLIKTPVVVIFSLFIAILLNRKLKFKGFFRICFFLPVLLGTGVVLATINGSIGTDNAGAAQMAAQQAAQESAGDSAGISMDANMLVMFLGPQIAYYLEVILEVVTEVLWMSGIQIVIFLGALQNIPGSYYEAAFCDGASEWEKFWKITLPLTMPNILLVTVYTMIDYISNSENEVVAFCQRIGLEGNFDYSGAAAMSWLHFLSSGILVAITFLIIRRFTFYADE